MSLSTYLSTKVKLFRPVCQIIRMQSNVLSYCSDMILYNLQNNYLITHDHDLLRTFDNYLYLQKFVIYSNERIKKCIVDVIWHS